MFMALKSSFPMLLSQHPISSNLPPPTSQPFFQFSPPFLYLFLILKILGTPCKAQFILLFLHVVNCKCYQYCNDTRNYSSMLTLSLYFRTAFGRAYWMSQRHSNSMCPNQATIFPLKPTLHLIPLEHEWQQYLSNTLDVCFHLLNSSSKLSQMCLHLSISIYTRLAQVTIIFIMKLLINPSWRHLSFSNLFTLQ